jgi:hypothetical protein
MPHLMGIDFGFSVETNSLGYSHFHALRERNGQYVVRVVSPTAVTTLADFTENILTSALMRKLKLIALDAPVTPVLIQQLPAVGRSIEKRFSRGAFSNGRRGPQPSSIRVPQQGWKIYCAAMAFVGLLTQAGFPYYQMQVGQTEAATALPRCTIEVIPKLTQTLLTPQVRTPSRPPPEQCGFYCQIDNWLFPHLFVLATPVALTPNGMVQPAFGGDAAGLNVLLGQNVVLHQSVWDEAARIQQTGLRSTRHELIGGFVAGFQGALALAGAAQFVGAAGNYEGYYVLPANWNPQWQVEWQNTARRRDVVYAVPIAPHRN